MKNCMFLIGNSSSGILEAPSFKIPVITIQTNMIGTTHLLEIIKESDYNPTIVSVSSSEVYGEPIKNPIDEKFVTQGKSIYAISKLVGEEMCKAYQQKHNLDYSVQRNRNSYTPC